ncbi:MAG: hypothetical protein EHM46_06805, partial [Bacteroidetes bacterium]
DCRFNYRWEDLENRFEIRRLDPRIRKLLGSLESISISRQWENDLDSRMVMGEELQEVFNEFTDQGKEREARILRNLENLNREIAAASAALEKTGEAHAMTLEKVESVKQRIHELKKSMRKFGPKEHKVDLKAEIQQEQEMLEKLYEALELKQVKREEKKDILEALDEKRSTGKNLEEIVNRMNKKRSELSEAQEELKKLLSMTGLYSMEKEQRAAEIREEINRTETERLKDEIMELGREYDLGLLTLDRIFQGETIDHASREAHREIESREKFYSSGELALEFFKIVPDFELFEDFSSLLPNRIDLEDIIRANRQAEGYKAAINFLTITGLEYSFFQQPSSRILKQKIENLNGELTLNFQDFWRQNVGKNHKIKINFELSHYDHTHPEKSGKPYIEFWIKDDRERLYPKQRSRGVRWFLSFFLELKATAMDRSQKNKVLLIDEPGVSLHARAQEDVLKVFDDIKDQMQIIYTTHSPHLIDVNKLYRILAVQRAVEDDMNSET